MSNTTYAGLDYGTSNSALGVINDGSPNLISLFQSEKFLPSTLYAYDRSLVSDYIYRNMPKFSQQSYKESRIKRLQSAASFRRYEGLSVDESGIYFGKQAIENYIEHPEEGVFIKSPKSFLGSTGLSENQLSFFADLVASMLLKIKLTAEKQLGQELTKVVIGRPVNYQGINSEKSNQQALEIMRNAANYCGYKEVEFLFEPLAAGVDFETGLVDDKTVLVVDIGGGTTDCSMVRMGPSYIKNQDRTNDFLAHTGQRIGGNDLDILLSYHSLMPLFGRGSLLKKNIELPDAPFWSAVSINNVAEQANFTSEQFAREIKAKIRDVKYPELYERFIHLQTSKLNHRLVRTAELAKIDLSESAKVQVYLDYIETELSKVISQENFDSAVSRPLELIKRLINDAVVVAQTKPDVIYITGGTAKSPTVRKAVSEVIPNVPILDGDYYGSVAAGLTKWADKIWR